MNPKVVLAIVPALGFGGCAAIPTKQTQWTEQLLYVGDEEKYQKYGDRGGAGVHDGVPGRWPWP